MIEYLLPATCTVRLEVCDLSGRRIITLVDGVQTGGPQSVTWRGTDANGAAVGSGVYVCRLLAGDEIRTRKMTLLR